MGETLHFLLKTILKREGYSINYDELKLQLLSHPSYPSLHSITGVLDHFSIENMALEVPINRETVFQLPARFISLISDRKEFVLVSQHEKSIEILHGNNRKKTMPLDEFLDLWSGIIVVIEKDSLETSHKEITSISSLNVLYILSMFVLLGVFFYAKPSIFQFSHFILSLAGIWISVLIIKHEFGYQSKALDKICTANETTSCDAVLNSKRASISKDVKLSDISLMYFAILALSWILSLNLSASPSSIILLTLAAIPVTLYSIYYQYNIVKKWCPLCLGIVTVLWLQCCILFFDQTFVSSIKPDIKSSFILFFSFLITTSLWLFLKPLLKKQQELEKLEIDHYKFKRNFDLFNAVFGKGEVIETTINNNREIVLGKKNALLQMLVITNPSCFYCKEAHTDLEKVLNKNPDMINISIRFNVPLNEDVIANKVAKRLLEIYNTQTEEKCKEALHEVYKSDADLNKWLLKWGESDNSSFTKELEIQQKWCHKNNINFTPALYINGKPFPKEYNRSDINYFVEDLIEFIEIENVQSENLVIAN